MHAGIIHFDILPKNINKVVRADAAVIGTCKNSLETLLPMLEDSTDRAAWHNKLDDWKKRFPFHYIPVRRNPHKIPCTSAKSYAR